MVSVVIANSLHREVVEGLLDYDNDINPKPSLATTWDVSPDGLTYRFGLRPGVLWHDGKPFTSADVAFSILLLKRLHEVASSNKGIRRAVSGKREA